MDAFCHPDVEEVVCRKSKRIGWTKILGHVLGYHIHQDPTSVLIVQPTIADSEKFSKQEIQPTIQETPVLRNLVGDSKSRSSSNTISVKEFPGGTLYLVGANSPTGFRMITTRVVLFDEVDGYPPAAGVEGDQIKLGMGRSETFWNRKHGIGSTPTIKGESRVERHFDASSKGYPMIACPHCGKDHLRLFRQPDEPILIRGEALSISHLVWDEENPRSAAWVCPHCGGLIDHSYHRQMIAGIRWYGEEWDWTADSGFTFHQGFNGKIGFAIWAGYSMSPNATPVRIALEYEDALKNPSQMVVFVNTVLGETYEEQGEQAAVQPLLDRVEKYPAEVPSGVAFLSAGIDIGGDRIELEVVGWGKGEESWSIDYVILPGEPTQPDVWSDLEQALNQRYAHESGAVLRIGAVGIDRGFATKHVDAFVRRYQRAPIWGVIGRAGFGRAVVESKVKRAKRLRKQKNDIAPREIVGVDDAKLILFRRITRILDPGPGYCHFGEHCDQIYFEQLTGERLVLDPKTSMRRWKKKDLAGRVEALDCRNYAYAAMLLAEPSLALMIKPPEKLKKTADTKPVMQQRSYVNRW